MSEDKNKKTTCNKNNVKAVLPVPTAEVIAGIVGVSKDYVKMIRTGTRQAKSKKAAQVKYCEELIIDGQKILLDTVTELIHEQQNF